MKKWWMVLGLLAIHGLGLWPFPQVDSGELYLVESLVVKAEDGAVTLRAEGVSGTGQTVAEALEDLAEHVPGTLFLRQTRRVILCGSGALELDPWELPEDLPVGACVYRWDGASEDLEPETLNTLLEARERRHGDIPDLAGLQNSRLAGEMPALEILEPEAVYAAA